MSQAAARGAVYCAFSGAPSRKKILKHDVTAPSWGANSNSAQSLWRESAIPQAQLQLLLLRLLLCGLSLLLCARTYIVYWRLEWSPDMSHDWWIEGFALKAI